MMNYRLMVATKGGLIIGEQRDDRWQVVHQALASETATCLAQIGDYVLAGTRNGVYRSDDGGSNWQKSDEGITYPIARWIISDSKNEVVFLGTEPAQIFVSDDRGQNWTESAEVARLRDQFGWFLPYSPEAGCVRGFAIHSEITYAAVEVGGVLRSLDKGKSWALVEGSSGKPGFHEAIQRDGVHADVHSIEVHPDSRDLVYAPTGGGFYRTQNGGKTWQRKYDCYCRAVWIDPQNPEHIILGPADGVDRHGRIEETTDGGSTWQDASNGLPTPWSRHMVERFYQIDDDLLAVLSNGELYTSRLDDLQWKQLFAAYPGINAVIGTGLGGK